MPVPSILALAFQLDTTGIDRVLESAVSSGRVPAVVGMAVTRDKILYLGAFGDAKQDTIFRIFSMTKAVTSVAAMQLVEQGKLSLDAPAKQYLPEFAGLRVLDANTGALRDPKTPPTLRHLLSHSAGFGYGFWDARLKEHAAKSGIGMDFMKAPLLFDPGTQWQYGTNTDVTGRIVERVSGLSLEDYFQRHIFGPLAMIETTYQLPASKHDRVVVPARRGPDGKPRPNPSPPAPNPSPGGGAGLYSTAADYARFLQMFLNKGKAGNTAVLKAATIDQMASNQIGTAHVRRMMSTGESFSRDFLFHPEGQDKFGLGFQINTEDYAGGRSKGSLAWAGAMNTFFWIDRSRGIAGLLLMQIFPFFDVESIALLGEFERAVYKK